MAKVIRLAADREKKPKHEPASTASLDAPSSVLQFRKKEKSPPQLDWARATIAYQNSKEFKDYVGYQQALARQQAERFVAARQKTSKTPRPSD
jgi:hypothetical protein